MKPVKAALEKQRERLTQQAKNIAEAHRKKLERLQAGNPPSKYCIDVVEKSSRNGVRIVWYHYIVYLEECGGGRYRRIKKVIRQAGKIRYSMSQFRKAPAWEKELIARTEAQLSEVRKCLQQIATMSMTLNGCESYWEATLRACCEVAAPANAAKLETNE